MASGRHRCVAVVVGESAAAAAEGVVKAVKDKVSKRDLRLQHERIKHAQFVPFSDAPFQRPPREEARPATSHFKLLTARSAFREREGKLMPAA